MHIMQRRKKKCDEVLPKCSDCRRLNLVCTRAMPKRIDLNVSQPQNNSPEEETDSFESSESPSSVQDSGSLQDSWISETVDSSTSSALS